MRPPQKCLIWDFDGTLGFRVGGWPGALAQIVEQSLNRDIDTEVFRPFMHHGFPWQTPTRENPPGRSAEAWWEAVLPVFEEALCGGCHLPTDVAASLAKRMRAVYTDVREWRLYEDTLEVLTDLQQDGWNHAILSNHVPELPELITTLGLGSLIGRIINSAETGFEKPNPSAFKTALTALENPAEVWMIGDNIEADVLGAESVGLRAILVRSDSSKSTRCAKGLKDVRRFLGE